MEPMLKYILAMVIVKVGFAGIVPDIGAENEIEKLSKTGFTYTHRTLRKA